MLLKNSDLLPSYSKSVNPIKLNTFILLFNTQQNKTIIY